MFSVSYPVSREGQRAFLKALDFSEAAKAPDVPTALQALTEAFNFERNLLRRCVEKRMDRIVVAIQDGKIRVDDSTLGTVNYLIFEFAEHDIRSQLALIEAHEVAWKLRALHHIATGLRQLHLIGVAHQDVKPSNVLVFKGRVSKVADLGCASVKGTESPRDELGCAGDPNYAPPELLYDYQDPEWNRRRFGCDAYLLGSMITFLFVGTTMTAAITSHLHTEHMFYNWGGTYQSVLPYVRDAFGHAINDFAEQISDTQLRRELVEIVSQLCDPDPSLRGHPLNRTKAGNPLSLERYLARLDLLARRAEIGLIKG
jgi:serine/threonine protein kinase